MSENNESQHSNEKPRGKGRGFAAMDPARQREIAREGGRAAHKSGHAHEFTSDEARAAGRKGGEVVSANSAHMAEIGRKGGLANASKSSRGPKSSKRPDGDETTNSGAGDSRAS